MTTDPPVFEDWNGDTLHVLAQADDIRVTIGDDGASVDIPFADVRKVTAAMHEKAGLPNRWAALRDFLYNTARGMDAEEYRTAVIARMDDLEAGQ